MTVSNKHPERNPMPLSDAMRDYWRSIRAEGLSVGETYVEHDPPLPDDSYCPECGGLGVVRRDYPVGHPNFGKLWPCPLNCKTVQDNQQRQFSKMLQDAAIPVEYTAYTFDSWNAVIGQQYDDETKSRAFGAAWDFAYHEKHWVRDRDGQNPRHSLALHGDVGVGKTGLMVSIANVLMQQHERVLYTRCDDLIQSIQDAYKDRKGNTASDLLNRVKTFPFLLVDEFNLDEFHTEKTSRDKRRIIESIVRYRYANALPMVITTNLDPAAFSAEWGERIADPLKAMAHWVYMGGVNLRHEESRE